MGDDPSWIDLPNGQVSNCLSGLSDACGGISSARFLPVALAIIMLIATDPPQARLQLTPSRSVSVFRCGTGPGSSGCSHSGRLGSTTNPGAVVSRAKHPAHGSAASSAPRCRINFKLVAFHWRPSASRVAVCSVLASAIRDVDARTRDTDPLETLLRKLRRFAEGDP